MRVFVHVDAYSMTTIGFVLFLMLAGNCAAQQSLSLAEAIQHALNHRPELKAAAAHTKASESLARQAGVFPNPRLIFQSENLRTTNFDFGRDADTFLYASQVVETSGRRGARIDFARSMAERTRLEEQQIRLDIALKVSQAYWNAIATDAAG